MNSPFISSINLVLLSPFFKNSVKFLGILDDAERIITLLETPLLSLLLFFKEFSLQVSAIISTL